MVIAGEPDCIIPHHTVPADQDILQRVVQGMPHVQLSRNIGRRNDNGKRFSVRVRFRVEIFILFPELIPFLLHRCGIIRFRDVVLFCHVLSSCEPIKI